MVTPKKIADIMTPRAMVAAVGHDRVLNRNTMSDLRRTGYARFPVYNREGHVTGLLLATQLDDPAVQGREAGEICLREVYFVEEHAPVEAADQAFAQTGRLLLVVVDRFSNFAGVLSAGDLE